jgi:GntR family transcriptional regulator, transcriptional repressor for pyruvate dehydrogenase complex
VANDAGESVTRSKPVTDERLWNRVERESSERSEAGPRSAEDLAAQVQQLITAKDLADGARLPSERDLVRILCSSRPTVSQAIRILVVRGLVESRRGSGAYVTRRPEAELATTVGLMLDLDQESVLHLSELRLWLETTGIERAIERATPDEIAAGEAALGQLRGNAGNVAAWVSADTRFHATLVRASQNPYLSSIFESVHATLVNYEYQAWIEKGTVPAWLQKSQAEALNALHEPILDAVRSGDAATGARAVLRHHEVMAQHLADSH